MFSEIMQVTGTQKGGETSEQYKVKEPVVLLERQREERSYDQDPLRAKRRRDGNK